LGVASVKALTRYEPRRYGVHVGRRIHRLKTRALVVSVNAYDRTPPHPLRRSQLDRGYLALYLSLQGLTERFGLMDFFGIEEHRTRRLAISSTRRRIRVMSDGELHLLDTPLRYRVHRRGLKVVVPAQPLAEVVSEREDAASVIADTLD
jgi:diacylglycerol kinase family enzyme